MSDKHAGKRGIHDMTRLPRLLIAAILALALAMPGCAGQKQPQKSPEKTEKQTKKNGKTKKEKEKDPIASGANKMQSALSDLKESLDSGDTNEVREKARKLDDSWESFERKVEEKNPDMYNQVETSLNIVLAGVQIAPFDTNVISAEIDKLDNTLGELEETKGKAEEPEKVDPKTGAAAMRQRLTDLESAVDSGDTAKMQEQAKAVDRSWTQFEGEVKKKDKTQYEMVEDHLHAILAGVKASPVDKNKLKQQISNLDAQLKELSSK